MNYKKFTSCCVFILIIFSFFTSNVLANVNITFLSDSEKIINVINLDNNYSQVSSNFTNQTINLTYDNYIIKLYATNNNITNHNGTFIINNIKSVNRDIYLIIWLAIIIVIIYGGYYFFKRYL